MVSKEKEMDILQSKIDSTVSGGDPDDKEPVKIKTTVVKTVKA